MEYIFYTIAILSIFFSLLPLIQNQFWFFRIFDFVKIQILVLQVILFIWGILFVKNSFLFLVTMLCLAICIVWEITIVYKFTPLYKVPKRTITKNSSKKIAIISANVYQFNTKFDNFIALIQKEKPNIFTIMESNLAWEKGIHILEEEYKYTIKVPLENTYGMHLYSKLPIKHYNVHYFVADDIPSIEASFETEDGYNFTTFVVHPPPPSPTEESNSKERDGELLAIAKHIRENDYQSCIVIGDFNNVAWGKSSILFRKISQMIDPRIGLGIISTYHAKYWLLRFPIDQMFHSIEIFVTKLTALNNFGSDHLPLSCEFVIDYKNDEQKLELEELEVEDLKEADKMIKDGIKEDGDRDKVATE